MRAVVTGSAGFVGRHMVTALKQRGYTTVMRVDPVEKQFVWNALDVFRANIIDEPFDLVVHCAAHSPHRAAIDREPWHFARNLELDAAMFDWAARTGQKRVLYLSSSAAYPIRLQTTEWVEAYGPRPLAEHLINLTQWGKTGDWSPDASYGWTKLTGEMLARAAAAEGLVVHVVRPFSGYGPDQGENWPFGAFLARARRREDPFVIWGDGRQVRDWIHIDDLVDGALAVVDADVRDPVNLCTGRGTSMLDLARMMTTAAGYEPRFELRRDAPAGVAYRVGDPGRLHQIYRPRIELAEAVWAALRQETAR